MKNMSSKHFSTTLMTTIALWTCINFAASWPLSENTTAATVSMKFLKSRMVPSVPFTTKSKDSKKQMVRSIENDKKSLSPFEANFHRLPPSPANLLKPDRFQFYTYNERGDMITKQMTMQEIQALIAGGGPDHSNTNAEVQEPQKVEDILTGGKKVMDVVEKVQSVLKSAMGKPTATLTGSLPTVPEKANVEWSNILPAILAGDKYGDKFEESHYIEEATPKPTTSTPAIATTTTTTTVQKLNFFSESFQPNTTERVIPSEDKLETTVRNEAAIGQTDKKETQEILSAIVSQTATVSSTEKLMIPVAVITAEENAQIGQRITQSPVFQKITEIAMMPFENALDDNDRYKEKDGHASTASRPTTTTTTTSPLLLLESTSKVHDNDITELVTSMASKSKNESWIDSLEEVARRNASLSFESKITSTPEHGSINAYKDRPNLDNGSETDSASLPESNKIETFVSKEPFTLTSPFYSFATFTTSTDEFVTPLATESLTGIRDASTSSTSLSEFDATQPPKPLSVELVNSLSSVINQVSETVSSVLPISSDFESVINSHYENNENEGKEENEKKKGNVSEISTDNLRNTETPIIHSTKFPPIHEEKPANGDDAFHDHIEATIAEATTKIQFDREPSFSTMSSTLSSPLSWSSSNTADFGETNKHSDLPTESNVTYQSLSNSTKSTSTRTTSSNETTMSSLVVTLEGTSERVTSSSPFGWSNTSLENLSKMNFTKANVSVNRTKPTAIIDSILETLSTEVNTPVVTEALTLPPSIILSKNSSINTLASGLIAGFERNDGSNETTLTRNPPFNSNASSASSNAEISSSSANETIEKQALKSKEENENAINENQSIDLSRLTNSPKETEIQTQLQTIPVTRPSSEHFEGEIELSSNNRWKDTRISSSIIEITTKSIIGTDESHVSPLINKLYEHASSIAIASIADTVASVTSSASTNSVPVVNTKSDVGNSFKINSNESSVSNNVIPIVTVEKVSQEVSKINETSSPTRINNLAETSSTKRMEEIVETNTRKTTPLSFVANSSETEEESSQEHDAEKQQVYANSSSSTKIDEATIIVGQNWNVLPKEEVVSNVTEAEPTSITTTISTTAILSHPSNNESDHTLNTTDRTNSITEQLELNKVTFDSTKLNGLKNKTIQFNESVDSVYHVNSNNSMNVFHESQQTNEKFHSDSLISSKPNNSTEHSEHIWQRISLHQTTPMSSPSSSSSSSPLPPLPPPSSTSSSSSSSSSSSVISLSTKEWIAATKKPEATPESTTRFEVDFTKEKETGSTGSTMVALNASKIIGGLDISTRNASTDIVNFSRLCNELAFKFWTAVNSGLSTGRSLVVSPFGMISLLAMIFLGARGSTSDQMNEILGLDNVATFNPHLIFQNVTDTVSLARHQGIANAAFVRELFADKAKVRKLLPFYKEQAQQFYEGLVAEVNFATISDLTRRRTNLLIRKQTGGRIKDFVKNNAIPLRSPLAAISANVFQTECNASTISATGRDGELYFAVSSSAHRLRKLIPVPAIVWRSNVLAGYEPNLDATAIAVGDVGKIVSTIFLLPGQQGHVAPGDTLDRLEQRLVKGAFRDNTWDKLLNVLIPRTGLELQIPKFTHRSVVNATAALKRMGLDQLFSSYADFKGINGIGNRLFLSDVLQMNLFGTCGDENIANGRHHVEIYPASPSLRYFRHDKPSNVEQLSVQSSEEVSSRNDATTVAMASAITTNAEKSKDKPRLKLDQPFLYFVRHNPTGLILHMGRFNPRLL